MENQNQKTILDKKENKPIVTTYATDMVKAVEYNQGGGVIRKIIEMQEKEEEERRSASPLSRRNKVFLILSLLLILIAFSVGVYAFIEQKKLQKDFVLESSAFGRQVIFLDNSVFLDIGSMSKDKIAENLINQSKNTEIKEKLLEGYYLIKENSIVPFKDFIFQIEGNLEDGAFEYIEDLFLFGTVKKEENSLFLLINTTSFGDIFNFVKNWEDKMFFDLYPFFDIKLSSENGYLLTKDFESGVVLNKNARYLKDNDGNTVFFYVYSSDNTLLIAKDEETASLVVERLNASRVRR